MIDTFIDEWKQKTWFNLDKQRSNCNIIFKALGLPNEILLAKRGFDTSLYNILSLWILIHRYELFSNKGDRCDQ